ncbi:hypothetical protein BC829DRAFT_422067 [Chytridium lagenaria]|nr:hypothetical protein BC829DRAFT_422067 [Chytridium lagenaria]
MDFSQYFDLQKVTETFNKVKNAVLQLTEYQIKVLDATNNEPWGASSTLMLDIANATSHYQHFTEIMEVIYKRLQEPPSPTWRQTYKALQLLEYLIKNGSDRVINHAREHIYELKALRNFNYVDEKQKDQVKQRAREIIELLGDNDKIKEERRKAKENRAKYTGVSSSGAGGGGGRYGGFGSEGGGSYRDEYESENRSPTYERSTYSGGNDRSSPSRSTHAEPKREAPKPIPKTTAPVEPPKQSNLLDFGGDDWGDFSSATNSTQKPVDDFGDFADFQSAPSVTTNTSTSSFASFPQPTAAAAPAFASFPQPVATAPAFASFPQQPAAIPAFATFPQPTPLHLIPKFCGIPNRTTISKSYTLVHASVDPFTTLVSLDANSLSGWGRRWKQPGPSLNSLNTPFVFPAMTPVRNGKQGSTNETSLV